MLICPKCRAGFNGDICPNCGFQIPQGMSPEQRMQYENHMNQLYMQTLQQERAAQIQQNGNQYYYPQHNIQAQQQAQVQPQTYPQQGQIGQQQAQSQFYAQQVPQSQTHNAKWVQQTQTPFQAQQAPSMQVQPQIQMPVQPQVQYNNAEKGSSENIGQSDSAPFQIWKLLSGIICVVLFLVVIFQSCAAGVINSLEANGDSSGTAGVALAFFMLTGGIASIVLRKSKKTASNISLIVLFGLGFIIGLIGMSGVFKDLIVWTAWVGICASMAVVALIACKTKKSKTRRIVSICGSCAVAALAVIFFVISNDNDVNEKVAVSDKSDSGLSDSLYEKDTEENKADADDENVESEQTESTEDEEDYEVAGADITVSEQFENKYEEEVDETKAATDDDDMELAPLISKGAEYDVTDIHFEYEENSIGGIVFFGYVEIQNTGNVNLYLDDCTFDIEDDSGHLLQSETFISSCPDIIAPGEKGYFYNGVGAKYLDEGVSLYNGINLNPVYKVEEARGDVVDYIVSDLDIRAGTFGEPKITGRIENTTDEDDSMCYINVIFYDSNDRILAITGTNVLDLTAGSKKSFECSAMFESNNVTMENVSYYTVIARKSYYQF